MIISTAAEIQKQNAEQYRQYFADLAESDPKKAKKEAKQELIAMGLFSQDGKRKKTIVSWE